MPSASTFTRFGITLNLAAPAEYFLDVCGGHIIQRPFTITSITNATVAMINPSPHAAQGLSAGLVSPQDGLTYNAGLNIIPTFPLLINTDCTILGSIAHVHNPNGENTFFGEHAFWTALSTLPTTACVSPPYAGTDKTIAAWMYESAWNFGVLATYPVPSPTPPDWQSSAWMLAAIERRMLELAPGGDGVNVWTKASNDAVYVRRTYGQNMAPISNLICLWLQLNIPLVDKKPILYRILQWAVDSLGVIRCGGRFTSQGMQALGRMQPNLVAAAVMGGTEMTDSIKDNFIEHFTHDNVLALDVTTPRTGGFTAFVSGDIGRPWWWTAVWEPNRAATGSLMGENVYRSGSNGGNLGTAVIAQALGLRGTVGRESFFLYNINHYWPTVSATLGLTQYLWPLVMTGPELCTSKPVAGKHHSGRTRTITCATPSVSIYYTTNGSTPTNVVSGTNFIYSTAIPITTGTTKVVAYDLNGPGPILTLVDTVDSSGKPASPSGQSLSVPLPSHLS